METEKRDKIMGAWDGESFPDSIRGGSDSRFYSIKSPVAASDELDRIKAVLKSFPKGYQWLTRVASPVCPTLNLARELRKKTLKDKLFLNIGSGNVRLHPDIVNVDIADYPNVDVVADAAHLPFKDGSVDGIVCEGTLEHVRDPRAVVAEMRRVLKPGASADCVVPFMQGYHASPHDYSRLTLSGMRELFKDFEERSLRAEGGPTSALLWLLQEWLAILLSFGSRRLHRIWFLAFTATLWPLKFLDYWLIRYPASANISSLFRIVVTKPRG